MQPFFIEGGDLCAECAGYRQTGNLSGEINRSVQERTNWFLPGISDRCLALFRLRFLLLKIFTAFF